MANTTTHCDPPFFPYDSHCVVKEITIPCCAMFIKQEVTIECFNVCHRCNRCVFCRPCPISYYYLTNKNSPKSHCEKQNLYYQKENANESTRECNICFDPCTPYVEKSIQGQINDGRLLQLVVNLSHFCPNRTILLGVILTSDDEPFAVKTKTLKIAHHCIDGSTPLARTCFEFLIPENFLCAQINAKFIIEPVS